MTHQETSIQAYHDEENSGRLERSRAIVEYAFRQHGPGTTADILRKIKGLAGSNINLLRARATELKQTGALLVIGTESSASTGRDGEILEWVPPEKRIPLGREFSKNDAIVELCQALEQIIDGDPFIKIGQYARLELLDVTAMRILIARSKAMVK